MTKIVLMDVASKYNLSKKKYCAIFFYILPPDVEKEWYILYSDQFVFTNQMARHQSKGTMLNTMHWIFKQEYK